AVLLVLSRVVAARGRAPKTRRDLVATRTARETTSGTLVEIRGFTREEYRPIVWSSRSTRDVDR
ncbi:hypothetical protein PQJ75_27335, partial [Rhodoplanes sp. TEM]